ncbi:NADH-cytochrome b5 reductase 1 [Tremella mesenterica]|uniref:NADH-cytochrome b5 reductase n=1 Tax=Tremella mesenterica TaxID=5217 RepID=A0A4Q1BNS2_TREME|nr:NADH-cytochrome b5 reductase 1 [Tremella mesenterica]
MDKLNDLLQPFGLEGHVIEVIIGLSVLIIGFIYITARPSEPEPHPVLSPTEWRPFTLTDKIALSHNTARYVFSLPKSTDCLGLPIGQHISVSAEIDGKEIMRSYTPVTLDDDLGHFDLVVKTYDKGNISRYLSLLTIGQQVRIKGPRGKFAYTRNLAPHLLMIAGGTGITPMYQIIKSSLKDPKDKTELALIYANVNEDDILLRDDLEKMRDESNGRFKLYHTLNHPPADWTQGTGFVTKEMIEQYMPKGGVGSSVHGEGEKVLMCGPPPMIGAMK